MKKGEREERQGLGIYLFISFYSAFFAPQLRRKAAHPAAKNRAFRGSAIAPAPACGCVALRAPYNPLRPSGFSRLRRINFSQQK
jgi:hypothetical protein